MTAAVVLKHYQIILGHFWGLVFNHVTDTPDDVQYDVIYCLFFTFSREATHDKVFERLI